MKKLLCTAAALVVLALASGKATAQNFQTVGDGPTELSYAYSFAAEVYMAVQNDYVSSMSLLTAMGDLEAAYNYYAANDIAAGDAAIAAAILGHGDGMSFGLIDSFFIDQQALAEAITSGQGFVGAPGNSYKPMWYALWMAYYAFLDHNTWYN